jgi:AraC-like DNA-binding protein
VNLKDPFMMSLVSYVRIHPFRLGDVSADENGVSITSEAPGGVVKVTHLTETFVNSLNISFDTDSEFLGLVFNLGDDIPFSWATTDKAGLVPHDHFNLVYLPHYGYVKYHPQKGSYSILMIEFPKSFLDLWVDDFPLIVRLKDYVNRKSPCLVSNYFLKTGAQKRELVQDLVTAQKQGKAIHSRISDIIALCLHEFFTVCVELSVPVPPEIANVRDLLLKDLRRQWSLDLLASECGIERRRLNIEFKKAYGTTVFKFLFEERMKKAYTLVTESYKPMKQIAHEVGFKTETHFFAAFKKRFNNPPRTLRVHKNGTERSH